MATASNTTRAPGCKMISRPASSDADIRNTLPLQGHIIALRVGDGLSCHVLPGGAKRWRTQVQRLGKESTITLGSFPAMTLAAARKARMAVLIAPAPSIAKREESAAQAAANARTVAVAAEEWIGTKLRWTEPVRQACRWRLAKHVYPRIGDRPVSSITVDDIKELAFDLHQGILANGRRHAGPATAVAVQQYLDGTFSLALARDWVKLNPVRQIADHLPKRDTADAARQPHAESIEDARAVLAAVERRAALMSPWTVLAHRLIALTGVRKMEALEATWPEIDLAQALWTIPAARMKGKGGSGRKHLVVLSPQALDVLRAAWEIRQDDRIVFASPRKGKRFASRHSLNEIMATALKGTGLRFVPHGWRHTFSTIMNESTEGERKDVIDGMIAHKPHGASAAEHIYNNAKYLPARRRIAAQWADMLLQDAPSPWSLIDRADPQSNVVPMKIAA